MRDVKSILADVGLKKVAKTRKNIRNLELWQSAICSSRYTLQRLGANLSDSISDSDLNLLLEHLCDSLTTNNNLSINNWIGIYKPLYVNPSSGDDTADYNAMYFFDSKSLARAKDKLRMSSWTLKNEEINKIENCNLKISFNVTPGNKPAMIINDSVKVTVGDEVMMDAIKHYGCDARFQLSGTYKFVRTDSINRPILVKENSEVERTILNFRNTKNDKYIECAIYMKNWYDRFAYIYLGQDAFLWVSTSIEQISSPERIKILEKKLLDIEIYHRHNYNNYNSNLKRSALVGYIDPSVVQKIKESHS